MNAPLTVKDFETDQEVRWCPGCGDYAILKAVQKTMADISADPMKTAFISGIGCSSRFPYYMNTYGFHTIHGRAPAFATGLKLANPEIDVWMVTGDGDGLSIGGNHLLHVIRRNVNMQIMLFNNEIYGLTKGQYSPTSRVGTRSPSSPKGSVDSPVNPCAFALGANARFVARGVDTATKPLIETLKAAHAFEGAAFVEIFQNCIVYNADVFSGFTEKKVADDNQIHLEHGRPMLYAGGKKGIRFNPQTFSLETVTVGEGGVDVADVLIHNETNRTLAHLLVEMKHPAFPMAMGVIYRDPSGPSFEKAYWAHHATQGKRTGKVSAALRRAQIWTKKAG